jgi:hypothetical protein
MTEGCLLSSDTDGIIICAATLMDCQWQVVQHACRNDQPQVVAPVRGACHVPPREFKVELLIICVVDEWRTHKARVNL